mmetsp:Transcript_6158/g.9915  ORF Transcript_6158/g.9915 Transcript_6158/m.9915 type:complete len:738 (+) Transcript_6158:325-2538(+)
MDSCLLVEFGVSLVFETQFLENWQQVVLLGLFLGLVVFLLLALLHLVASLLVDALLKNLTEDVVRVGLHPQLLDALLVVSALASLSHGVFFAGLDLRVALLLHLADALEELLFLAFFRVPLAVLLVHVAHLSLGDEVHAVDLVWLAEDLALLVVIIDEDETLGDVELGLADLFVGRLALVELELLSHLLNIIIAAVDLVFDVVVLVHVDHHVGVVSHAAVDELVLSTLEALEGLVADQLLSIDEPVLVAVVVEVDLSVTVIDLDELLPVVLLLAGLVVLDGLELVRQASPEDELVSAELVVRPHFFGDDLLEVFVDGHSLHQAVFLLAVREVLHLAFLVEHRLLTFGAQLQELVLVHVQLGRPGRRHIEQLFFVVAAVLAVFVVVVLTALFVLITLLVVGVDHDVLPLAGGVVLELQVNFSDGPGGIHVDPVVFVIENSFNSEVGGVFNRVFAAGGGLNKEGLGQLTLRLLEVNPAVLPRAAEFVFLLIVRLIVVDDSFLDLTDALLFLLLDLDILVELGLRVRNLLHLEVVDGLDHVLALLLHEVLVLVNFRVVPVFVVVDVKREGAFHQRLVSGRNSLGGSSVYHIGIVASANQKRAENDREIETVSHLPVKHVGRRRNHLRELVGVNELLVLEEVSHKLGALFPMVEIGVRQFGGADGRANKLADTSFVARRQQQLPHGVVDDLELSLVLEDVLQDEFFLGGVLDVATRRVAVGEVEATGDLGGILLLDRVRLF